MPVRAARTPRPETAARRAEIVAAAAEEFTAKGFNKASLNEIAARVGMTHVGVLHHFGSKEKLLQAVLDYRDELGVADLPDRRMPQGAAQFEHLKETAKQNEKRPGWVQIYAVLAAESVTANHPSREFFIERFSALRAELETAFRTACAERGITDPGTIDKAAAAIVAVMDGLQVQWLLDPANIDLADTTAFAIDAIVDKVLRDS